jgi:hypothetical protein
MNRPRPGRRVAQGGAGGSGLAAGMGQGCSTATSGNWKPRLGGNSRRKDVWETLWEPCGKMAHRPLVGSLVWKQGEPTIRAAGGVYGRFERQPAHRVVRERCYGPIVPRSRTVDHLCQSTLCQRPDHM